MINLRNGASIVCWINHGFSKNSNMDSMIYTKKYAAKNEIQAPNILSSNPIKWCLLCSLFGSRFLINLLIILPMNKIMKNPMKWYKIKSELLFVELRLGVLLENSIKSQSPSGFWNMTAIEKMMAEKTKLIIRCAKPIWNPLLAVSYTHLTLPTKRIV